MAPLRALADSWPAKLVLSIAGSLLRTDEQLVGLIVLLLGLDFLTGVRAAHRRGEKVTSTGMRRMIPKAIEYAVVVIMWVSIGNSFKAVSWVGTSAYLWVALTEAKSIVENLYGQRSAEIWAQFQQMLGRSKTKE